MNMNKLMFILFLYDIIIKVNSMIFFKYIFIFLFFSFIGWILELVYRGIRIKKIVNPGFMSGCVVPLYGFGAVILYIICNLFEKVNSDYKIIIIFIISIILLSLLELISGIILDKCFNLRLWDYSKNKFNFKGHICLLYSMYWGFLSLIFYNFIYPKLTNITMNFINSGVGLFILGICAGLFLIDLCVSIGLLNRIVKYSKIITETIDLEKLKLDIRRRVKRKKIFNSLFPYIITNKYLRDKLNDKKNEFK